MGIMSEIKNVSLICLFQFYLTPLAFLNPILKFFNMAHCQVANSLFFRRVIGLDSFEVDL